LISHGLTGAVVQVMKETIHMKRPSGGLHSFPSGHTSYAFVGATALYHEFRETQPLLAYSGFVFATATGVLRITNNAHWFPDVVAGAAVGIFITNLVYQSALFNLKIIRKHNENITLTANLYESGVIFKFTF
jgi:membrane-associated phospholipid phosphatase